MGIDLDVDWRTAEAWDDEQEARSAWLRENDPIHWSPKSDLWVLTRYRDVSYVSKHQELFTSAEGVRPDVKIGLIDEGEPRHGNLRRLINRGFTPGQVQRLEGPFREIVTEIIDRVAKRGVCDFAEDIAVPIPLMLIAEMLGIRKEDRDKFHQWSDAMMAAADSDAPPETAQKAGLAFMEYAKYVTEVIEDRRKSPRDDLLSILTGAKDEGLLLTFDRDQENDRRSAEEIELGNDELIMLCVILLVAGNETTRNGISGSMQLLIEHPAERQKLIEDPSKLPVALEEMLRLVSPVRSFLRTVTKDTELDGTQLRQGQKILLVYPSANRDPAQFDAPDEFRLERDPAHLAFGVGTHFCLGANLARMEMRVTFEELLRRLPDVEFADGGPEITPHPLVRACKHMHVRFTPEG